MAAFTLLPPGKPKRKTTEKKATTKTGAHAPTRTKRSHGRHTITKAMIKKDKQKRPGRYPLSLAERRLGGLYAYVKRHGGHLPE